MLRIAFLLLVTMNAYCLEVIPLTHVQSYDVSLTSPIGLPAISHARVGKVNRKQLSNELFSTTLFVIGADPVSIKWLEQNHKQLQTLKAIGFITNVTRAEQITTLQERYQLPILPVNVDSLLQYIEEKHYPFVISQGVIWQ